MKKKEIVWVHLLFWFLVVNLSFVSQAPKFQLMGIEAFLKVAFQIFLNLGFSVIGFYAAYFSLNVFTRKPIRFLWLAGLYGLVILGMFILNSHINQTNTSLSVIFLLTVMIVTVLFSLPVFGFILRMGIQGVQDSRLKRQLEQDKLNTQMELLKSQINPHFLFNTLNNIDILIKEDPDRASQFLNKLSDILRYSLYETKEDLVPLEMEIENIRKYVELQKIRTQNESYANLTVKGDLVGLMVAPMVFLPFIENAFKHSSNKKIENAIVIDISVDQESITFSCRNHCSEVFQLDENSSGLGLNLIRSRFDLLFKDRYTLENKKEGEWYEVNLNINRNGH